MDHPKPLGELLYCTLQNLYYHSIAQQESYLNNGMRPRIHENCTIELNGARGAGFSWALRQFLLNDCEKAIVVAPNLNMADRIWRDDPVGRYKYKERGHIFSGVGTPDRVRGHATNVLIFSDYALMKATKGKELKRIEDGLLPVLHFSPGSISCPDRHKALIRLH